jgi:hypothetical protein
MTVRDIAYDIVDMASHGNHPFSAIQEVRRKHGENPRSNKPFAEYSIKERYAFHAGGRKELQFNIGLQKLDSDDDVLRYGVAFSLQQDNTVHNPKSEFKAAIKRFNKFLNENPHFFKGYEMWYHKNRELADHFNHVVEIDDNLFQAENFIFIGKFFDKEIGDINGSDLKKILDTFDHLMPLYEAVTFGVAPMENRVSRLCWNNHGWILPSGPMGKSKNKDTHEGKYGYGHEEWLFDISKIIDGYHYAFLEPIRKQQQAFDGKLFNIWLYTINSVSKKRYWVGQINNVEVLDKQTAIKAWSTYKRNGWLKEMESQIQGSGAKSGGFSDWKGIDLFNVRFLPEHIVPNEPIFELPRKHPVYQLSRYAFVFEKENFHVGNSNNNFSFITKRDVDSSGRAEELQAKAYYREPKTVEIIYLHKKISQQLTKHLKSKWGTNNVTPEHPSGLGSNKIDIVTNNAGELTFYEIKTYISLTFSIREALGQLFEYSFYPNLNKANKLIMVTQPHNDCEEVKKYFKFLRSSFGLNIYYQYFDWEKNFLSDEF